MFMKIQSKDVLSLFGRVLISGIFLSAGVSKFKEAEMTEQYMTAKNLPRAPVLRPVVGAAELVLGASLLLGYKPRSAAIGAIAYLIPTSLIFHDFWNEEGQDQQMNMIMFLKNLAIMGGLLNIVAHGQGSLGIERAAEIETPFLGLKRELMRIRRAA